MNLSDDEEEVTVYNFQTFDGSRSARLPAPFKATREQIESVLHGKVLEGTAERVLASQLDEAGRFRRLATGWGDLN